MQNKKDGNSHKKERSTDECSFENNHEDNHNDSIPVLENDPGCYDYKRCKGTTNLTVKKDKHCGILKEKPPLDYCNLSNGCINNEYINDDMMNKRPSLAVKIFKFYGINLIGCSLCRDGVSCSEGAEIKFSSECCCVKEIETIFGILKLRRIFKDKTFNEQGYKYKTELQIRMLNEILRITPYPNSQTLENLAVLLNLKPRSVQIWFQNARQGGDIQFSKDRLKGLRKSTSIDIRMILEIFVKVCYEG